MTIEYSVNPDGERFALPGADDYPGELARLEKLALEHRSRGREVVVVVGVGFVGAVMAAVPVCAATGRSPCLTGACPPSNQRIPRWTE